MPQPAAMFPNQTQEVQPSDRGESPNPYDKKSGGEETFNKKVDPENQEDMEKLQEAITKTNKFFKPSFRHFEMSVHKASRRVMVKVVDNTSGDTIREVPSEKFLDMVSGFIEMAGLIVDTKA